MWPFHYSMDYDLTHESDLTQRSRLVESPGKSRIEKDTHVADFIFPWDELRTHPLFK